MAPYFSPSRRRHSASTDRVPFCGIQSPTPWRGTHAPKRPTLSADTGAGVDAAKDSPGIRARVHVLERSVEVRSQPSQRDPLRSEARPPRGPARRRHRAQPRADPGGAASRVAGARQRARDRERHRRARGVLRARAAGAALAAVGRFAGAPGQHPRVVRRSLAPTTSRPPCRSTSSASPGRSATPTRS